MALVRRWGRTTVARFFEIILSFLYRVEEITTCTFWDIDIIHWDIVHWDIVHYPVDEILGIDIDASDDKAARLLWKARPTQVGRGISSSIRASFGYPSLVLERVTLQKKLLPSATATAAATATTAIEEKECDSEATKQPTVKMGFAHTDHLLIRGEVGRVWGTLPTQRVQLRGVGLCQKRSERGCGAARV